MPGRADTGDAHARRSMLALFAAALCAPTAAHAQTSDKPWRIAFLAAGSAPRPGAFSSFDAITAGLRERGWAALQTQAWFAEGRTDALPVLAQQVLAWRPDVIVASLTPAMLAAQRATRSIPIVMVGSGDPVATGLVQSLARPGGNVTGVAVLGPELAAKSVELLRDLLPGLKRLGVLAHAADPFTPAMLAVVTSVATTLGLELIIERVDGAGEYAAAFGRWRRQRVEALLVQPSLAGEPAAALAVQQGLPSCSFVRAFAEQGGLLAYGSDRAEVARLSTDAVDRILRGASPALLPVQLNTRFELLINLRTARALGVTVPAPLLQRATELIE
jgi:putative ABC transport system substrate-binding protein